MPKPLSVLYTHLTSPTKEHQRKIAFAEEFIRLCKKHRISYDEWYLWG